MSLLPPGTQHPVSSSPFFFLCAIILLSSPDLVSLQSPCCPSLAQPCFFPSFDSTSTEDLLFKQVPLFHGKQASHVLVTSNHKTCSYDMKVIVGERRRLEGALGGQPLIPISSTGYLLPVLSARPPERQGGRLSQ